MNLYGFVGNDGLSRWDKLGCKAGVGYYTYAEAKAAEIADLKMEGWASWNRGKGELNKRHPWWKIPAQINGDWGVYNSFVGAGKLKRSITGSEYFTIRYCIYENGVTLYYY